VSPRLRAALLLLMAGCAHIEAPSGGPEDEAPPKLIATRPDTLARVPAFTGPVVLVFDERLSEQGVEEAVQVSPRTSAPDVDRRGDEIRVSLRRGWEAGHIYQITVLPRLQDLFNNRITAPIRLVFSTGPAIPDTRVTGTVVDRLTGRGEAGTRVEAVLGRDSLAYAAVTDSAGGFTFRQIPEGAYRVRAYRDANASQSLDSFEARDTASLTVAAGREGTLRLRILQPDTTAPAVTSVQVADSVLEVKFDDALDPAQRLSPAQVTILLPDSSTVPVAEVTMGRAEGAAPARADTTAAGVAAEPLPARSLRVRPARPIPPATEIRVRVRGVTNLHGRAGGGEATVRTPAAPAIRAEPPAARPDSLTPNRTSQ
jgi:hypothetical protein